MSFKTSPFYYRVRYYLRKIVVSLGFCPDCWTLLNWSSSGRGFCPYCGKPK